MSAGAEHLDADLLLQHASSIRQLALRLVRDPIEAEDLVQDTWAAALAHPPSTARPLRPWLGTVLRNFARRAQRRSSLRPAAEAAARAPASVADPAEVCEGIEAARLLAEELGRLEEPYRTALYLRYYQELAPVEIARRLGIPSATLRSHLKRGIERLRVRLDERHGGEREAWCVLLAPLCRFKVTATTSVAAPAIATTGILAMNATLKIVAALAAVAIVYVGLSAVGVVPERLSPFGERPAREEARVAELEEQDVRATEELPAGAQLQNERRTVEAAAKPEEVAVPPTETTAVVEALLTNELGIGLAGAELRPVRPVRTGAPTEGAVSAASGFVSLSLELGEKPQRLELQASARGHATVTRAVTLVRGETTRLGTIALPPGGAISGVVFDEDGRGVEGALVSHEKRGAMGIDLEAERYERAYGNPLNQSYAAPLTTTDRNGAFTLRGLPEGHVRLWAEAGGTIPSFTEPIEVYAGLETPDVEIVLQAIGKDNSVAGRVVSPDGEPIPHAILEYRHEGLDLHYSFATSKKAEADGSFRFALNSGAVLSITARDPQDRYGPRTVERLEPGVAGLELRLSGGDEIELVVNGEDDLPLPEFRFAILDAQGTKRLQTGQGEAGVASFRLPPEDFLVQVSAPLHERVTTDPLPCAKIRKNVVIRLERVPGVHGRVFAAGEPVIGATVELYRLASEDTRYEHQGFRCWLVPRVLEEARSDDEGRFLLTARDAGEYVVQVELEGYALAEAGPLTLGPELKTEPLEIHLTQGGAIEGRVILPHGADPTGTMVGLHRGDGKARFAQVEADGMFGFDRLTPGPWNVSVVDANVPHNVHRSSPSVTAYRDEVPDSCRVVEGQVTFHDIEVADPRAFVIEGEIRIEGIDSESITALACRPQTDFFRGGAVKERVTPDEQGRFELGVPEDGEWRIVLMHMAGTEGWFLADDIVVDEPVEPWSLDIEVGSLRIEGLDPRAFDQDMPPFVVAWTGPGDACFASWPMPSSDVCTLQTVPAGKGRLARIGYENALRPDEWETLLEYEVAPGETTTIRADF